MAKPPKLSEEVKGFLDEANAASDPARTAWLAFLLLLTYVVVTLASVSHKDLLLNSPVRLPIINADIPLVGFFQYAPAMLLLVYLSLLVQHVILARKYRRFTDALAGYELRARTRHVARERVHLGTSATFVPCILMPGSRLFSDVNATLLSKRLTVCALASGTLVQATVKAVQAAAGEDSTERDHASLTGDSIPQNPIFGVCQGRHL